MDNYQTSVTTVPHSAPVYEESTISSAALNSFDMDASIIIVFFASLIELIAAAKACDDGSCTKYEAYAVALGCVSLALTLVYLFVGRFLPQVGGKLTPFFACFLVLWWAAGAGVVTFKEPFKFTTNGYFASWIGFLGAASFAFNTFPPIKAIIGWIQLTASNNGPATHLTLMIFLASAVEMIAASIEYDEENKYKKNQKAWAVAVGVVSMVVTLIFLAVPWLMRFLKYASVFLTLWWVAGLGVLTFDAPFLYAGNGYFACWFAFCVCLYLQYALFVFGQPA